MINLRDYKSWDKVNGTLSVSMLPKVDDVDSALYVVLNGSTGNFCLDYSDEEFDALKAKQRAWSSDSGYYVKIIKNEQIKLVRWWDDYHETLPYRVVQENTKQFYQALNRYNPKITDDIVSFAKEAFIKLRNCIQISDNGQASLRTFMYLLAALNDGVDSPNEVDVQKWHIKQFEASWIAPHDWEWLYSAFQKGAKGLPPLVTLVLRHASNKLFQEAHREATRKEFQTALWGGANRAYNSGITEGAFYTPTALVRTIVQEALWALDKAHILSKRTSIRILDPACGSSEFLRETLRQLKMRGYEGKIEVVGWDISEIACEMSNFVLHHENNTEWNGNVSVEIINQDSLEINWNSGGSYDLVLMNPPFMAFENLGNRKESVVNQLDGLIKRQPDLSSVFWKKAAEVTSPNGVLGLVLPHSLLSGETYQKLRLYIENDLGINFTLIARLGSAGLFEKAMIIPSVLIGIKNRRSTANTVLWTDHQQRSVYDALRQIRIYRYDEIPTPVVRNNYSIYEDQALTKGPNWTIHSFQTFQLSERLKDFSKVGDLFKIKRGADAGNNAAFILSKQEWLKLSKSERKYFRPSVMRESIQNGQLIDSTYLFFPYGEYEISSDTNLVNKLPSYYKSHLSVHKKKLKERKGFEEKWWLLNRPRSFHDRPKLISAYFGRAGYFAFDQSGEYVVGQSFAWIPIKEEMDNEQYYFAYLALLHAPIVDKLLEMVCNVLHGGYFDLSKHYIDKMPLPDLSVADPSIINELNSLGRSIHENKPINKEDLNQIVANAYGVNLLEFKMD